MNKYTKKETNKGLYLFLRHFEDGTEKSFKYLHIPQDKWDVCFSGIEYDWDFQDYIRNLAYDENFINSPASWKTNKYYVSKIGKDKIKELMEELLY